MRAAYGWVLGDQPPAEHPMELEVAS
jgi:hypothetical protein